MSSRCRLALSVLLAPLVLAPLARPQAGDVFSGRQVPLAPPDGTNWDPLAVADVDLDGRPDLVSTGFWPTSGDAAFFVVRGLPGGGFAAPQVWPLGSEHGAGGLAVGPVNGDGWPDVVVCTGNQRAIVSRAAGGGNFFPPVEYFVGTGELVSIALADLDRDGATDLLTGSGVGAGSLNVNLADGGDGFLATRAFPATPEVWDIAVGDLDGDGWLDAATSDLNHDAFATLRNDGAGGFLPPVVVPCEVRPQQVELARLDADGDLDLLLVASNEIGLDGSVCAWLNDGSGALAAGIAAWPGKYTLGAALHDLDLDGDLDVVAANGSTRDVALLLNDGGGKFSVDQVVPAGFGPHVVAVLDAHGDGVRDILASGWSDGGVLLPAAADGSFAVPATWGSTSHPRVAVPARLDDDAWPDVLCLTTTVQSFVTLLGEADGFVLPPLFHAGWGAIVDVRAGDLDGDGRPDAVAVHGSLPQVLAGKGLGDGSFAAPATFPWAGTTATPAGLELADLDDDGLPDVLVRTQGAQSHVVTLRSLGAGQLAQAGAWATLPYAYALATGDLDADGAPDAVTVHPPEVPGGASSLAALAGDGAGGLLAPLVSPLPPAPEGATRLALGDMDLDGLLDALVAFEDGAIALASGDGGGGFAASGLEAPLSGGWALAVGDADGDGWPDVLHGGDFNGAALVLRRGDGAGGLAAPETYAAFGAFRHLLLADMTLDGRPELLVAGTDDLLGKQGHVRAWDNLAAPFTWTDLGFALAGRHEPRLAGTGELRLGSPGRLLLSQAAPGAAAALYVAPWEQPTAFKGGVLVPVPVVLTLFLATDALGRAEVAWSAFPGDDPGAAWAFQAAVVDAGAPGGVALSNALRGTQPPDA